MAVGGPVPEHLADVTVRALLAAAAVVRGVGRVLGHLRLGGAVLRVVEIKAVADVTEEARRLLGLSLLVIAAGVNARHQRLIATIRRAGGRVGGPRAQPPPFAVTLQAAPLVAPTALSPDSRRRVYGP